MSKKEKIKTMIAFYQAIILAMITGLFSIFGYSVINYDNLNAIRLYAVILGIVVLIVILIVALSGFFKEVKALERLD